MPSRVKLIHKWEFKITYTVHISKTLHNLSKYKPKINTVNLDLLTHQLFYMGDLGYNYKSLCLIKVLTVATRQHKNHFKFPKTWKYSNSLFIQLLFINIMPVRLNISQHMKILKPISNFLIFNCLTSEYVFNIVITEKEKKQSTRPQLVYHR